MVLVTSILAMLFFGAMGLSIVSTVSSNLSGTNDDLTSVQAFNVAEGGMQYILQNRFAGDSNFSDNVSPTGAPFGGTPISLSPGQFWVEYLNQTSSSVDIRVTGRVGNSVRVIGQSVGQGGSGYDYATMANGNININSATGDIYGDLALRGTLNVDPNVHVHGNITDDPDLELPTLDLNVYEDMCTSTHVGNLTISANTTSDLCVTGNVTIDAGVTYNGLLYSSGNINVNGDNVVVNGTLISEGSISGNHRSGLRFTEVPEGGQHMPALASLGNINLTDADNMQITGVIWNGGNADLGNSTNMVFRGSLMAGGNFIMNSATNLSITFDADLMAGIPGLTIGGESITGSLSLSGYKAY